MTCSRRALLAGSGIAAIAATTAAVGLREARLPDAAPGTLVSGTLVSRARRGRRCGWTVALPPGSHRDLPVVVVLHGRGNDHASVFSPRYLALDTYLAAVVADGTPPMALASIDGGEAYWHARADGDDPAAMVVEEFLPLLRRRGLDTRRVGLGGWSMGGYGALHLAGVLGRRRVAAVAAMSPALWESYADTAPGAFDDERDFQESTVMGRQASLRGVPVRVDCGLVDPFCATTRTYVDGFAERPSGGFERGGHDVTYWRRQAAPQLRFLGTALARAAT